MSLSESIKTWISGFSWNWIRYRMQKICCNTVISKIARTSSKVFFLDLVSNAKVVEIGTSFLGLFVFSIFLSKIVFLAIVIPNNLTSIFFLVFTNRIRVDCVESCSWGRFRVFFLVLFLSQIFLFLFFTILIRSLHAFGVVIWACSLEFLGPELVFLVFKVFYWIFLGLNLNCSSVDRTVFLLTLVITFSDIGGKLKARFDFNCNCFLNNLFSRINFLINLLYLSFNRGLKTLSKKLNKIRLFSNFVSIKFNKMNWRYSRCVAKSQVSSSWY